MRTILVKSSTRDSRASKESDLVNFSSRKFKSVRDAQLEAQSIAYWRGAARR